ncbi:protein-glutamate O-methyltransferase [Rhodospirillaceae bacterium SYSU D60014]|uniref:CheR family methyltransferase n=1 Tax=Virgifigura deserti TaxID=2268457 RepID=UPI000E675A5A
MNVNDFDLICRILKDRSGLTLSKDKAYLLESRLLPVARRWKLTSFDELARLVRGQPDETLLCAITEAMTTNESFFFRDAKPFEQFQSLVLPRLLEARAHKRTIRIWSAACSTGQEPYSLAMILDAEANKLAGWRVEILATDLSNEIIDRAREGTYSQFEVQRGLPISMLVKYFQQVGDRWQINAKIRDMVTFRSFNLLNDLTPLGSFDVVFCRNVLIYFDQQTKSTVLARIAKQMPNDGFLYLGGAETVLGVSDRFQVVDGQRGIYGLVPPGAMPNPMIVAAV